MLRCVALFYFLFAIEQLTTAQSPAYKIAYNVFEDTAKDNYDIYIMTMDGSGKKNISNTTGVEWVYYAYEERIFFIRDRDTCHRCYFLYEMDANGNNVKKLSNLQLEDIWMSSRNNAKEMIVLGRIGKQVRNQLFLINLTDGSYQQITNDTVSTKADPLFLPNGNEIIIRYRPDRNVRRTVPDELWKITLETLQDGPIRLSNNKTQLPHFPKSDTSTEWFRYHAGPPQWNAKVKFISYLSRQKKQNQIYAVTPDGKKQWQITSGNLSSVWHAWSPDGNWLVMDKQTHDEREYDIYLMNYTTKKNNRLTESWKTEQGPVFVKIK
ncbi:MAG: TolB family protein [Chitinophagaceae bacterium]